MIDKRVAFRDYAPDLPRLVNPGLTDAKNMRPKAGGWYPARGLANLANATALSARPQGALSGTNNSGSGFQVAGDATKLYVFTDTGMTDRSRTPGYSLGQKDRWAFAQFGNEVYAATRNEDMQFVKLGSTDVWADVAENAPRARHLAVASNKFLVAGNIIDADGVFPNAISWSARNAPRNWPTVGSDAAVSVQSDRQVLEGDSGPVQDIVTGADVTAVFRERSIHRMDEVNGDKIFLIPEVDNQHGMLVPYSGVAFGRSIFYIASDGFRIFDYTQSSNIGKDRVDRTFMDDLDQDFLDRVWTAKDPDQTVIWILYPGSGNVSGRPNKLLLWDFALDKWSNGEIDAEALIENVTETPASLDAPENLPTDPMDLDDPGTGPASFDDRLTGSGNSRMGAFDTGFVSSDFTGAKLEGLAETGDIELIPGRRSCTQHIRPMVSRREARVSVATRPRTQDDLGLFSAVVAQDSTGKCSIRKEGRYHSFRVELPAGWDDAIGFDVYATPSGNR